jgi:large subunit ribosomal protein L15
MVVRRTKKILKRRGQRSPGYGSQKKHRGSGSRGGTGKSGLHKHKRATSIKYYPDHFGKRGFKRPPAIAKKPRAINLSELDQMLESLLEQKKITKEKGYYLVDLAAVGYDRLLGTGRITHKITVQAKHFSSVALKKLEEAGCKAVTVGQDG